MKTYQDLLKVSQNEKDRMNFCRTVISEHKTSKVYRTAEIAKEYFNHRNVTICNYQKFLYTVTGKRIVDNWNANFKTASRFFYRFLTQENQYLLGNGVTFRNENTESKLGTKEKPFDNQMQEAGIRALWGGVSFGFFNVDHIDVFSVLEYAPLFDEINGGLRSGVRFWQVDADKPLRATLYEPDGYTEYMWTNSTVGIPNGWNRIDENQYAKNKVAYKLKIASSIADGDVIIAGENYPDFPIVPLWGNAEHQSEIVGLREQIDCYDLIKSGFANNVDDADIIYWTLANAGGMDDIDLARFVERMKKLHAVTLDDDVKADMHSVDVKYQSREALLNRLEKDLYKDAMALNVEDIAGGAVTATQIEASYEPLNSKVDMFEYCVIDFINKILFLAGIDDEPSFTRSAIINRGEMIQTVLQSAAVLPDDYVVEKILTILGDKDKVPEILDTIHSENLPQLETGNE